MHDVHPARPGAVIPGRPSLHETVTRTGSTGTSRRQVERQGQLDIEMESSLRPREIQTRIRAGESLEDVARAAGVPVERIEPYAGPVLAEREHIAGQAQRGSARRRGETTGHRVLRTAVAERLATRGVDPETVVWDSLRMDDGRWSVSATYASGEATREAVFFFDPRGRFSVAGNDEARWLLGEQSPTHGPQPGRRPAVGRGDGRDDGRGEGLAEDAEPTLDLNDELAIVRAIQEPAEPGMPVVDPGPVVALRVVADEAPSSSAGAASDTEAEADSDSGSPRSEPESGPTPEPVELDETSELDLLFDMLGGEGYSEDSGRVYPGLTETGSDGGWDPAVVVNDPADFSPALEPDPADAEVSRFPSDDTSSQEGDLAETVAEGAGSDAEPEELELPLEPDAVEDLPPAPSARTDNDASLEDAVPESAEAPAAAASVETKSAAAPNDNRSDPQPNSGPDGSETVIEVTEIEMEAEVDLAGAAPDVEPAPESAEESPAVSAPAKKSAAKKRKRAEVPSWDEIMFGGPKRP